MADARARRRAIEAEFRRRLDELEARYLAEPSGCYCGSAERKRRRLYQQARDAILQERVRFRKLVVDEVVREMIHEMQANEQRLMQQVDRGW
jgi:hypothetical protein